MAPENLLEVCEIQLNLPCAVKAVPVTLEIILSPYFHVFSWQVDTYCLHGCLSWGKGLLESGKGPQKRLISEINLGQEVSNPSFTVPGTYFSPAQSFWLLQLMPTSALFPWRLSLTPTPMSLAPTGSYPSCDAQIHLLPLLPASESFCSFDYLRFFAKVSADFYCSKRSQHILQLS